MRPPRRPPHSQKGKNKFIEAILSITILIHIALFLASIAGILVFGINEKLYNITDNMTMVSECVNGVRSSSYLLLYSLLILILIGLVYGKIEPKLRKDHWLVFFCYKRSNCSAICKIVSYWSNAFTSNALSTAPSPKYAPKIFPATEPVESLSPLWLTAQIIAFLNSSG